MIKYVAVWIFSVLIASFAQVLLKKAANRTYSGLLGQYLNPIVVVSYGIMLVSTMLTTFALHYVPYSSYSPAIESISYISAPLFGVLMLREKISRRQMLGFAVILLGIVIFKI
ncbi:MAG: multidrug ABC transporter [Lachnospiraceae bacterium]|nr:multidrug ABC transporter [Lachnospiraceae bacterium]